MFPYFPRRVGRLHKFRVSLLGKFVGVVFSIFPPIFGHKMADNERDTQASTRDTNVFLFNNIFDCNDRGCW